jgi:mevalonate kinase
MSASKSFYSKIFLFGEYSIIKNSWALSIPYSLFEGKLTFRRDNSVMIDPELKAFSLYLKKNLDDNQLSCNFDITSFEFDISQGLFFDSTIPQGYGVGSSGALVAAIFDRYSTDHFQGNLKEDIFKLKNIFAQMESHFHGTSSGLDPLISYLNSPLLIKNKSDLDLVQMPTFKKGNGGIFLINTKRSRKTEPLVNLFLEKCSNASFDQLCERELAPITNECIKDFLNNDLNSLEHNFKRLSKFQFENFTAMIPKLYRDEWLKGIETNQFYFKLCGAGGGGFLMGITHDFNSVKKILAGHELRLIISF